MKQETILELAILECDHHSHRLRGRLRCCRCGGQNIIGHGWVRGRRFGPLRDARCKESGQCS